MNTMRKIKQHWMRELVAACIVWVSSGAAMAVEVEITAVFEQKPGSTSYKFENTTPISGVCKSNPRVCEGAGFSVATGITTGEKTLATDTSSKNDRDHAFFKLIDAHVVNVKREGSAKEYPVTFTPNLFGAAYETLDGTNSRGDWVGNNFVNSTGGRCTNTSWGQFTPRTYAFAWKLNNLPTPCVKKSEIPRVIKYSNISFGYNITMPNPLKMASGVYYGSVRYTVGAGRDLDFGDGIDVSTDELVFNFTLTVLHDLKVQLGANGNTAELVPAQGWDRWIGKTPPALSRDLPFQLTSSGPLRIYLSECKFYVDGRCGINNGAKSVPIDVAVTLPQVERESDSISVRKVALGMDKSSAPVLQPTSYLQRQPSLLHFSTNAESTKIMTAGAGDTYTGNVTIMFDTDID